MGAEGQVKKLLDQKSVHKIRRLTLSCRVTWARSVRVNSYNRQRMILPIKTKTYAAYLGPGNLYHFPTFLLALAGLFGHKSYDLEALAIGYELCQHPAGNCWTCG